MYSKKTSIARYFNRLQSVVLRRSPVLYVIMLAKAVLFGILAIGISYYVGFHLLAEDAAVPSLPEVNWGLEDKPNDKWIKPFKIDVPKNVIEDLNERLSKRRDRVPPLEKAAWTYGISSTYLEGVLDYWRTKYDWYKRQELLNKYPQYITKIQGLDIHFYHIKPNKVEVNGARLKVLPLILVHGWPGSVVEFQKIIPMLTSPSAGHDFVFELVIPSLPGYGFSQGAVRPGLGHPQVAVILNNLMIRLGYEKYYTQGGDWGSVITTDMAILFPERVFGTHLNMCYVMGPKALLWQLIGAYIPSLVIEPQHHSKMYPLKQHWSKLIEGTGYMHIQSTKPDTIGSALADSPAGMAAYILEKFSGWTDPDNKFKDDGGLLEKFNLDELLDNVMIYWITNSITTSFRLYAESFNPEIHSKFASLPTKVPTACANFPHEVAYISESIIKFKYENLVQFHHLPRGGHFAAFEEPKILSDDVWKFVKTIQANSTRQI